MEQTAFFGHLERVDKYRRALVAMSIADAVADHPDRIAFTDLAGVLKDLLFNARKKHWPHELGAAGDGDAPGPHIGAALPADVLIAAASMTGHLDRDFLIDIERALCIRVPAETLDLCAHAIGSTVHPEECRLDGIEPDLLGEFFSPEALIGDPCVPPRFPCLPEMAWRAAPSAMERFVARARQNFRRQGAYAGRDCRARCHGKLATRRGANVGQNRRT